MSCKFTCDGCGTTAPGVFLDGRWFKPSLWFERSDEDGPQDACSRECIARIAEKTGKTSVVLPI
jgi:hypothetical protein